MRLNSSVPYECGIWEGCAYHDQNNGVGPGAVDILDHVYVGVVEVSAWDLVRVAIVVSAHLDDDQVGGLLG